MVEPDRPDNNIIRRMRFTCCITKATDTLRICNTYCFSTATMVTRTRLDTYIACLVLYVLTRAGKLLFLFTRCLWSVDLRKKLPARSISKHKFEWLRCSNFLDQFLYCFYVRIIRTRATTRSYTYFFFSSMALQPLGGLGHLIIEASRSHSDTPRSVGFLWTSDQPVAETSIWQHTTLTRDRRPCFRLDSNPQSQ
jgi:hypothetical protein